MKHTVTIEKLIVGGRGLTRSENGMIIMVEGVLPGEIVKVAELKRHRGYIEAELLETITPSPARIKPVCPWYHDCGGCDLQHCDYEAQLQIKKNIIRETLDRAGVNCPAENPADTLPSPNQLAYRYRLRMKVDRNGQVGFHRKGTNTIVPVMNCAVATDRINAAISFLQSEGLLDKLAGNCGEIELLHSPAGDRLTILLQLEDNTKADLELLAVLNDCEVISDAAYRTGFLVQTDQPIKPLEQNFTLTLEEQIRCTLSWSADCFSQVNAGQNEQLVQLVCRLAGDAQDTSILDLYCGMGNFSIPMALKGAAVTGIELNRESISWAKRNAESAGVICSFFAADVHTSLRQLVRDKEQVNTIVLDPPRRGIGKAAKLLPQLGPQRIIYISCDPATLARDLATVCKQGYSVRQVIPVDMFPQTHHIESVTLLEKN